MQCNQDTTIDCPIQVNTNRTISSKASIGATETNNTNERNYRRKIKRKTVATVSNQQSTGKEEKWSISFLFLLFVAYSFATIAEHVRPFIFTWSRYVQYAPKKLDRIVFGIPHRDLFPSISLSLSRKKTLLFGLVCCAQHLPLLMLSEHQRCLCFSACVCVNVSFYTCISRSFDSNV